MNPLSIAVTVIISALTAAVILFCVYIFLIAGRRKHPEHAFFDGLFAHRGLYSNKTPEAPENSMPAFSRAVGRGFGIELDVHISKDGELFVFHDDNMRRMCSIDRKIEDLTAPEIESARLLGGNEAPPRFSDVLRLVGGRVPLVVELKCEPRVDPAPLCRAVSDMMKNYTGEYCIESFNPYVLGWYRKNEPSVFRGQLAERFYTRGKHDKNGAALFALENLWLNVVGRPDFVAYNCLHRDALSYRLWRHVLRMPTALWTIRDENTLADAASDCECRIFESFIPQSGGEVRP